MSSLFKLYPQPSDQFIMIVPQAQLGVLLSSYCCRQGKFVVWNLVSFREVFFLGKSHVVADSRGEAAAHIIPTTNPPIVENPVMQRHILVSQFPEYIYL
ncbi:hypothetical protein Tsubulata_001480 [Turnera subulata]|uniref:Uncharacterized protein n=1 Tax=Turnera subulata TaxID=218843 RepID=A0A9Q0J0B8_9ROSI|nr:hypothetical protein Tsubulata_001480 [Turnera subulata]